MAASGADNMQTELSADDAALQPPYQGHPKAPVSAQATETSVTDERKRQAARRPTAQRVRTVRLTTQVHPDMLHQCDSKRTGCTIDYCALSPDEPERSPQSHGYTMNFLVSAGSSEMLEDATRQLRKLVDRVQVHLQTKARSRPRGREETEVDDMRQHSYEAGGRRGMMRPGSQKLRLVANGEPEEGWDVPMQRVYYAPRVRRERPIYMEVTDVDADEKSGLQEIQLDLSFVLQQRGQSPSHFVARRRKLHAQMQEAGYAMYAVASPQGGQEQAQRVPRNRQPRHIYQGAPNHFAQSEYSQYEYDDPDAQNDAGFPDETADLTNENAGTNEPPEFVDVPDLHQPVHRAHPRRTLKRPLSNVRSDGPPPPPIYRQRMPYIYDYAYDEEDDEWMTEDEEMAAGYGYPPQFRPMEIPVVRRRRRFDSLLGKLDSYLENLFTESEQTLEERVVVLQAGLELFSLRTDSQSLIGPIEQNHDKSDDAVGMDWEDDGWFEESAPTDPVSDEDQENFVAHISPKKSNLKFEGDFLAVKLEEGASPRWPRELPPFVWSLLARVISSDPQSYVMRATHKRLMDEIAKGDPYYYLHPTAISKDTDMSSPSPSSPSQPCEFGCRGASALKWERKLVSQISSRMKSFDNVAYSLARSSGGKEVLNRKKMNSIIRKLHLVAMQLHSLVSHLYCVKGQATCKEVDSLPVALNNSHFERKMGVYKSRLKLVVPHKYQQQTQQQQTSASEPPKNSCETPASLRRYLGYNYRESQAKRNNSKSLLGDQLAGSGALFPLGFFRQVESLAFDFEHDSNGLLRCICDELLNIVCLWNDFKWTDNLETVALDRVVSFETDVTASIVKILELYAHHLQALWAVRLLDEPEQLRSVHFTQLNAYYSDRSQGSLNTAGSQPGDGLNPDTNTVDRLVADEIVEQRLAEEYWNRKPRRRRDGVDDGDPNSAQLLTTYTRFAATLNALSAVTNHMLKHEVHKYRFMSGNGNAEPIGSNQWWIRQPDTFLQLHAIDAQEDVNLDAQEQPELKDLVQLLAVTKQDMQELCGHRPRSARMREKVQTQSLQLARQTVEIFRNIRNMYESQRR
ncbi:hypothetical protein GQ600_22689 [Phytophthora cactorum]|nr:hypothetical protein GQ600_22689 [Phytophthora cactorum]